MKGVLERISEGRTEDMVRLYSFLAVKKKSYPCDECGRVMLGGRQSILFIGVSS